MIKMGTLFFHCFVFPWPTVILKNPLYSTELDMHFMARASSPPFLNRWLILMSGSKVKTLCPVCVTRVGPSDHYVPSTVECVTDVSESLITTVLTFTIVWAITTGEYFFLLHSLCKYWQKYDRQKSQITVSLRS